MDNKKEILQAFKDFLDYYNLKTRSSILFVEQEVEITIKNETVIISMISNFDLSFGVWKVDGKTKTLLVINAEIKFNAERYDQNNKLINLLFKELERY